MEEDNDYSIFSSSRTNLFLIISIRSKADAILPLTPLGIEKKKCKQKLHVII